MKIAVISDIHGNKEALDNVLSDIKFAGADKIFVLGDLAMGGYDPNYTIEKLFELRALSGENFEIIQGNTDKFILDYSQTLFEKMSVSNPLMAYALKLDSTEIKPDNKLKLSILPANKTVEIFGVKIMLCHGSPRRQDENIFPDTPVQTVEEAVKDTDASVIFCGHTHIPCGFSLESGKTLINAGSVGRSMAKDKMPVYLLMTVNPDGSFSFEHRKVIYDNKKVAEIITNRPFEKSGEFAKLYL